MCRGGVDGVAELDRVVGVAGEVALLAVVPVLRDVVHDKQGRACEEVLREARVEVDRARHRGVAEVLAAERAVGVAHDRGRRHNHLRAVAHLRGRRRHAHLEPGRGGRQRLGALGVAVEHRRPRERGEDLARQLQVHGALAPAPDDPDALDRSLGEGADAEHAGRRGARLGDPGGVHHGERAPRGGVGQDEQAVDVGQPEPLVVRVAGHPLHAHGVRARQVRGHRVDERVLARVHADLRRHLDPALPLGAEGGVEELDDLDAREPHGLDVRPGQIAHALAGHRRSVIGLAPLSLAERLCHS